MPPDDIIRPLFQFIVANTPRRTSFGDFMPPHDEAPPPTPVPPTLEHAMAAMMSAFILGPLALASEIRPELPSAVRLAITRIRLSIYADPAARLTLADLAVAAGVSASRLCRLFQEHLHSTPMNEITNLRLNCAKHLVMRTDLNLDEIAERCGFCSAFHLSRRFKQRFGNPPSAFREGKSPAPPRKRITSAAGLKANRRNARQH